MKRAPYVREYAGGQPPFVFAGPSAWRQAKVLRNAELWASPVRTYARLNWSDLAGQLVIVYDSGMSRTQIEQLTEDMVLDGVDEVRLCAWPPEAKIPAAGHVERIIAETEWN